MIEQLHPGMGTKIIQFAPWFNLTRTLHEQYYFYWLSLFICHGILIEDFLVENKDEKRFVEAKVIPGINALIKHFGVAPLIVSLPRHSDDPDNLATYPQFVIDDIWANLSMIRTRRNSR